MKRATKKESGSILAPHFQDEDKAREYLEAARWPDGTVCPHCGLVGEAYKLTPKIKEVDLTAKPQLKSEATKRIRKPRKGLWKCAGCRKQFTVTVGTIFEDSHIPLHKWLLAIHFVCASKKGVSAHQLMRMLDIKQYKSAWFMAHRIRYAMTQEPLASKLSGVIELDETYIGGRRRNPPMAIKAGQRGIDRPSPFAGKAAVLSILQRGGKVRSQHMDRVTADTLKSAIRETCSDDAHLMTDTARAYSGFSKPWKHSQVNHSANEYVRWEDGVCVTTNTIEGFFSILKRGVNGTFHHVSKKHLHRYLAEFDFRYNGREMTDGERSAEALKGFNGKRLMLKDPVAKK
jgi:transposase-like protein